MLKISSHFRCEVGTESRDDGKDLGAIVWAFWAAKFMTILW